MNTTTETIRTIDLGHDQTMIVDGGRDGRVRVLFGATWLTQEGDADDAILRVGAEVTLRRGRIVIEGLEPTRLQIVERAVHGAFLPTAWLRKVWHGARTQVTRLQLGPLLLERGA